MARIIRTLGRWCVGIHSAVTRAGRCGRALRGMEGRGGERRYDADGPVRMAGYASRTTPSQGVAHPLVAKALALSDAKGTKVVIVTWRHHRIPAAIHHPRDGPGQGQVRRAARERRAVRIAQPRRPSPVEPPRSPASRWARPRWFREQRRLHPETWRTRSSA